MSLIKRFPPGPWRLAAAALAAASLAGCGTPKDTPLDLRTPTEHYPLAVQETPDSIALTLHPEGLSAGQRGALAALAARWRASGGGEVVVQSPAGGGEIASRMASAAVAELQADGVDWVRIQGVEGGPGTPVTAGFTRLGMAITDCRNNWDNIAATRNNTVTANFGCATSNNLAAMIADPRHVQAPAGMQPADATRRQVVLENYRKGDLTASKKDEQASGAVAGNK